MWRPNGRHADGADWRAAGGRPPDTRGGPRPRAPTRASPSRLQFDDTPPLPPVRPVGPGPQGRAGPGPHDWPIVGWAAGRAPPCPAGGAGASRCGRLLGGAGRRPAAGPTGRQRPLSSRGPPSSLGAAPSSTAGTQCTCFPCPTPRGATLRACAGPLSLFVPVMHTNHAAGAPDHPRHCTCYTGGGRSTSPGQPPHDLPAACRAEVVCAHFLLCGLGAGRTAAVPRGRGGQPAFHHAPAA